MDTTTRGHSASKIVRRRGRPRVDLDIQAEVERLAVEGWAPAQIHRHLDQRKEFVVRMPSVRTVERIVQAVLPRDVSRPWTLADAEPDDAPLVLEVLGAVLTRTDGRIRAVSREHADWVVRIRRAAPDLDAWRVYRLALSYMVLRDRGESTVDLDLYLALGAWRNVEAERFYARVSSPGYGAPRPHPLAWGWSALPREVVDLENMQARIERELHQRVDARMDELAEQLESMNKEEQRAAIMRLVEEESRAMEAEDESELEE